MSLLWSTLLLLVAEADQVVAVEPEGSVLVLACL
jgi:hypothetical protein